MNLLKRIFLFFLFIGFSSIAYSQCAMCKAVVESEMQAGGTTGENINNGILYLMFIPYLLMGSVGYFIYRHYKKNKLVKNS